jgi:exonuclease VII large subunit
LRRLLESRRVRLAAAAAHLQALGPRQVLERGYTYCTDAAAGGVVARAAAARPGQGLIVHFADGERPARVLENAAQDVTASGSFRDASARAESSLAESPLAGTREEA